MLMRLAILFSISLLLLQASERLEFAKNHTMPFANGGTLRIPDSFGEVEVEGWDREEVSIELTKKTNKRYDAKNEAKALDHLQRVDVRFEQNGNEMTITTVLPDRSWKRPLRGETNLQLQYKLRVPRNTALQIRHGLGVVNVRGVEADMHVTVRAGNLEIEALQPDGVEYQVDARVRIGDVESEFDGNTERRKLIGAAFHGGHDRGSGLRVRKIHARVGVGAVSVQRQRP